jgi:hypothetical protein
MKIKEVIQQLHEEKVAFGEQVKILRVSSKEHGRALCENEKSLEGRTGTLTNPFSSFPVEGLGIFLDAPKQTSNVDAPDCCNLGLEDEIVVI